MLVTQKRHLKKNYELDKPLNSAMSRIVYGQATLKQQLSNKRQTIKISSNKQQKIQQTNKQQITKQQNNTLKMPQICHSNKNGTKSANKKDSPHKSPRICEIKYLHSDPISLNDQNLIKTNGFRSLTKKKLIKVNEGQSITPNIKQQIKLLFGSNSPYQPRYKYDTKIKLQTIYGTLAIQSPSSFYKKFPQKIHNLTPQKKLNNSRSRDGYDKPQNDSEIQKFLTISNKRVLKTHIHDQQLRRLKMNIQNRKIQQKHRKISGSEIHTLDLSKSVRNNFKKQKISVNQSQIYKRHSLNKGKQFSHRKNRDVADRYSPWHKQKTDNQLLYDDMYDY